MILFYQRQSEMITLKQNTRYYFNQAEKTDKSTRITVTNDNNNNNNNKKKSSSSSSSSSSSTVV